MSRTGRRWSHGSKVNRRKKANHAKAGRSIIALRERIRRDLAHFNLVLKIAIEKGRPEVELLAKELDINTGAFPDTQKLAQEISRTGKNRIKTKLGLKPER
ncbi:MAG: hypothetical protein ABIJ74_03675 [archaeon]